MWHNIWGKPQNSSTTPTSQVYYHNATNKSKSTTPPSIVLFILTPFWTHGHSSMGVSIHWTRHYWTGLFATESHFYALQLELPTSRVASYIILACNASLPAFACSCTVQPMCCHPALSTLSHTPYALLNYTRDNFGINTSWAIPKCFSKL